MPRKPIQEWERRRGLALGSLLVKRRNTLARSAEHVAVEAEISVETIRRLERGQIPNPGVFTVAALSRALGLGMDELLGPLESKRKWRKK
jgi:transcriptional regulator with XRE-family HTH domain